MPCTDPEWYNAEDAIWRAPVARPLAPAPVARRIASVELNRPCLWGLYPSAGDWGGADGSPRGDSVDDTEASASLSMSAEASAEASFAGAVLIGESCLVIARAGRLPPG